MICAFKEDKELCESELPSDGNDKEEACANEDPQDDLDQHPSPSVDSLACESTMKGETKIVTNFDEEDLDEEDEFRELEEQQANYCY